MKEISPNNSLMGCAKGHKEFPTPLEEDEGLTSKQKKTMRKCEMCKSAVLAEDEYCRNCGARTNVPKST